MPSSPNSNSSPIAAIYHRYEALTSALPMDKQTGLGGKLLFAGEIDDAGRSLLFAANIAGAASLAASAYPAVQRLAIRDGVVDFFVTSLEEALRILKNEIRKKQAVSVGVAVASEVLVASMLERGVLPDLLPAQGIVEAAQFIADGARVILPTESKSDEFVTWTVEGSFAKWLPRIDACAQAVVPDEDELRQRWLRLAPRYLGRMAQREHGVVLSAAETTGLMDRVIAMRAEFEGGESVAISIQVGDEEL